jgi:hypothetical protein
MRRGRQKNFTAWTSSGIFLNHVKHKKGRELRGVREPTPWKGF